MVVQYMAAQKESILVAKVELKGMLGRRAGQT